MALIAPVWKCREGAELPNNVSAEYSQYASQLRGLCKEAEDFEARNTQLVVRLRDGERRLCEARCKAAEVRATQESLAGQLPAAQRAAKIARGLLATAEAEVTQAQEVMMRRERDNHGLIRTVERLKLKLDEAETETVKEEDAVVETEQLQEAIKIESACLQESIESMGNISISNSPEQRVASEREKRLRLKAAVRAKLDSIEQTKAMQEQQVQEHHANVEDWKRKVAEQEARTRSAQADLATARDVASRARAYMEQQRDLRMSMHRELSEVQRAHEHLREKLAATLNSIAEKSRQDDDARKGWRMQHLERLDARITARQGLDKDIVVADAAGVNVHV